jgi:methylglutaconyl-CoA hydratase
MLRGAENATLPAIAPVNGVCMAGGMGLLCMTDMAVASDQVMFGSLINHVVPAAELDAKIDWLVERIADKSPTAIRRGTLRAIDAMSFDQAIAYTESQSALVAMTEDAKAGMASFNERCKPVWTTR